MRSPIILSPKSQQWLEEFDRHHQGLDNLIMKQLNSPSDELTEQRGDPQLPTYGIFNTVLHSVLSNEAEYPGLVEAHGHLRSTIPDEINEFTGDLSSVRAILNPDYFYLSRTNSLFRAIADSLQTDESSNALMLGSAFAYPNSAKFLELSTTPQTFRDAAWALVEAWAESNGFKKELEKLEWNNKTAQEVNTIAHTLWAFEINQDNAQEIILQLNSLNEHQQYAQQLTDWYSQLRAQLKSTLSGDLCDTFCFDKARQLLATVIKNPSEQPSAILDFYKRTIPFAADAKYISDTTKSTGNTERDLKAFAYTITQTQVEPDFFIAFYRSAYKHLPPAEKQRINKELNIALQRGKVDTDLVNTCFAIATTHNPTPVTSWQRFKLRYASLSTSYKVLAALSIVAGLSAIGLGIFLPPLAALGAYLVASGAALTGTTVIGHSAHTYNTEIDYVTLMPKQLNYAAQVADDATIVPALPAELDIPEFKGSAPPTPSSSDSESDISVGEQLDSVLPFMRPGYVAPTIEAKLAGTLFASTPQDSRLVAKTDKTHTITAGTLFHHTAKPAGTDEDPIAIARPAISTTA